MIWDVDVFVVYYSSLSVFTENAETNLIYLSDL